jgi:gamma-glutamyltranspeptidase/glutathione hydrolase
LSTPDTLSGRYGAVSAGSALAAGAAMRVLQEGGNAIDAAIAGSAVQCVVEMPWCGLGGDMFGIARLADGSTVGLNGSGVAPASVLDALGSLPKVPRFGPVSPAVPATVDAWSMLHRAHGSLPWVDLIDPAIRYAADGVPLDQRLIGALASVASLEGGDQLASLLDDLVLAPGELFRQRDLAETLQAIAGDGAAGFYLGEVGKRIGAHMAARGGALSVDDLAAHHGQWVTPLRAGYRGAAVHSNAPVSMGVLLLACLRTLEVAFPAGLPADDATLTDVLVRLKHLVFSDLLPTLGDPGSAANPDLLAEGAVVELAERLLSDATPAEAAPGAPLASDTTSIAVTAADGTSVCLIHSLFNEFGSRELVPGTGVILNDRLANLNRAGGQNQLAPGKRPMHTLHCYLVDCPDGTTLAGATPGGRGQVQTNLQVLIEVLDRGSDLQAAVTRPRWVNGMPRRAPDDRTLYLEAGLATQAEALRAGGHAVEVADSHLDDHFGNCTVVARSATGDAHFAAADHRRAGHAAVW